MSESEGRLPDFLVIGAQRCGTTLFYDLLCRHPLVDPARRKEVHFFDERFAKGEDFYRSYFRPTRRNRKGRSSITGEATPYYLFHPLAPKRAINIVPGAKLIVLLRNPIDRAYSHYHLEVALGRETFPTFEEAIAAEEHRLEDETERMFRDENYVGFAHKNFSYLARGLYAEQLFGWHEHFGPEPLLILQSEAFFRRPELALQRTQQHLKLPVRDLSAFASTEARNSAGSYPPMREKTRRELRAYFEPHNERLYELIGIDFGWR